MTKKAKKNQRTIVEVMWNDACCEQGWGADPEGTAYKVCSVGILTNVTKEAISMALQVSETGNHASVLTIPRGMVESVRKVGLTKGF